MTHHKPQWIAIGLAALLVLTLALLPSRATRSAKVMVGGLFFPLFGLSATANQITENIPTWTASRRELIHQIQGLKDQNRTLQAETLQLQALLRENGELREALAWQRSTPWKLLPARIIGRDPKSWWNIIQIDRGSADGVLVNMPVFVRNGAVGKVTETSLHRSQVSLLSDPNCRIAAMVKETRESGFIQPSRDSLLAPGKIVLSYLPSSTLTRPGNEVVTSDIGQVFPPGIPIGKVMDTEIVGYGLHAEARVELAVDPGKLNLVWIKLE